MVIEMKVKPRLLLTVTTLFCIVMLATASLISYVIIQNTAFVKSTGPEDPLEAWSEVSYMVWQYNSTFYAVRNMSTLMGEYFGNSDDEAIQYAVNETSTPGGTVYVKSPTYTGTYNAAVTLKDNVTLILEEGAAGIAVTIDSGATATLLDYHNYDFLHWDSGVLTEKKEDRSMAETASYVILREGSFYFAKNGTTGALDYSGTNASQVILNSINAITEGVVFLKAATYVCDTAITISGASKRVSLIGEGMEATILSFSGDIDGIVLDTTYHVEIANLKILGDNSQTNEGLEIVASQNILVQNVLLDYWNDTGSAVKLQSVWDSTFINVRHHRSWIGLKLQTAVNNNGWYGCRFKDNTNHGIYIADNLSNGNIFVASDIAGNSVGVEIENGISKITFLSSWFESNSAFGIKCDSSTTYNDNVKISDSTFTGSQTNHISLFATRNAVVDGNTFSGGTTAINLYTNTSDATISNNENNGDPTTFISDAGSVNTKYYANRGYITQMSGTAEASNDDWVSFGVTFAGTPQAVLLTVQEDETARYIVQVKAKNTTHFQLYIYDETAGAVEAVDQTISWYAEYKP